MVAYSFQPRFVQMIADGDKTHTLRNPGKRRHARIGETLQLYTGMRTRRCELIATATCDRFHGVLLKFTEYRAFSTFDVVEGPPGTFSRRGRVREMSNPEAFARSDGFEDLDDMARFWFDHHGLRTWEGFLIGWSRSTLAVRK